MTGVLELMMDLYVKLPNAVCGEVGEPLSKEITDVIHSLALANFWPVDFGEDDGDHTELWFKRDSADVVARQVVHFLKEYA